MDGVTQIFQILNRAIFSTQDQSQSAAQELAELLLTGFNEGSYGFMAELTLIISQSAMQIPIESPELHERLAKIVIQLSRLPGEISDKNGVWSWNQLPWMEGEFQDQVNQLGPGGERYQDWKRFGFFQATLIGLNSKDSSKTSAIRSWIRWGKISLFRSLEGSYRHFYTKQISSNPLHGEHHFEWLEMASIWIEKAGVEMFRSYGLEDQVGIKPETHGGEGPLWVQYLTENGYKANRWEFWRRRLKIIEDFEGSEEKVKSIVRGMMEKMEKIEDEFSSIT